MQTTSTSDKTNVNDKDNKFWKLSNLSELLARMKFSSKSQFIPNNDYKSYEHFQKVII